MIQVPAIPNFTEPEYEDFINKVINGCCIFLGAGFSKLVGFKLWDELADELVEIFWEKKQKSKIENNKLQFTYSIKENMKRRNDKIIVLDYLYHLDQDLFYCSIEKIFKDDRKHINYQPIEMGVATLKQPVFQFFV